MLTNGDFSRAFGVWQNLHHQLCEKKRSYRTSRASLGGCRPLLASYQIAGKLVGKIRQIAASRNSDKCSSDSARNPPSVYRSSRFKTMSKTVHQRFADLRIKNLIYVYLAQAVAHAAFLEVMTAGDVPRKGDPPSKDMGPRFSTRLSQDAHRPSNHKLNFGVTRAGSPRRGADKDMIE